jgi:hypothetical protein
MRTIGIGLTLGLALAHAAAAAADPWDEPALRDDGPATVSELTHGSDEVHDLKARAGQGDQDWFRIRQEPYSSYEVVVDGAVGDVSPIVLERIAADGTTVLQTSVADGVGAVRSLRFANETATAVDDQFVVVRSGGCTKCKARDTYRLRSYETTYAIPRFNNTASQVTVLVIQNPTGHAVAGDVRFWTVAGALLHTEPLALDPKTSLVLQTQTLPNLAGVSGSITVSHDGRYGDLTGKTSGLEPATGFLFESVLTPRPR